MQPHIALKTSRPYPTSVELVLRAVACITIGALIVCVVILSWVPPVSRDALIHHLAVPKLYLKQGHIYEIPSMVFSYFPMNLDLLYLIALYCDNDIAPKFIHFAFALLTAWLIFDYLKRRLDGFSGLLGVVLFLSLPIIVRLSTTVYVDLGLICFGFASLLFLLRYAERGFQPRYLVFAGLCCGLALGTKYNGLLVFFILTCLVPFLYACSVTVPRPGFWRTGVRVLVFVTVALMVYAPWGIRNYSWTGNPIYPFYHQYFKKKVNPYPAAVNNKSVASPQAIVKIKSESLVYRHLAYGESWWQIGLLPVRIFFQGKDDNAQYFDGRLNPYLLLFPLLAFFFGSGPTRHPAVVRLSREKKFLLAFAGLYFVFAFFRTGMRIRYIAPIIPPLVLLSVIGVKNIYDHFGGIPNATLRNTARGCVFTLLAFFLALNAGYIVQQFQRVRPFDFLLGQVSREEYIQRFRFEYPAQQYINAALPANAKILFVFIGKRGYYCDREYIPEEKILLRGVRRANDAGELCGELKRKGITHLLVHGGFLGRWAAADLLDSQKQVLQDFFSRHVTLLFSRYGVDVFVLEDPCGMAPQNRGQRILTSRHD